MMLGHEHSDSKTFHKASRQRVVSRARGRGASNTHGHGQRNKIVKTLNKGFTSEVLAGRDVDGSRCADAVMAIRCESGARGCGMGIRLRQ